MTNLVDEPTVDELDLIRKWYKFDTRITNFQNKFSMFESQRIFGDEEGERLFLHFRCDCNDNYKKFKTYLTTDQYNTLLVEIVRSNRY